MNTHLKRLLVNRENYVSTLAKLFDYSTLSFPDRSMSRYVDGDQIYTYSEFRRASIELSHKLSRFGIGANDKVALFSQNMPNWTVAMFSVVPYGRIFVPILPDSSENEVTNILTHSDAKVLFVSKRCLPKVSQECMDKLTLVIELDTFKLIRKDDLKFTCEGWVKEPLPDDLAMILYTSGTSGNAKGVMLSHRNLCHNVKAAYYAQKAGKKDVWLSILPMAHTYEMALSLLYPLYVGGEVCYLQKAPTPSILMKAMKEVRPTIMCSVPLIIEKIYKSNIVPTIRKSTVLTWLQAHMPWLLNLIIGSKLKKTFGGRLKFFGIGGSKLDSAVEQFLIDIRFPYAIGYGLTETAPLITAACVGKTAVGSIGLPVRDVEVRIDNANPETGEGEIIARGDNVMLGYYKDPERTREAITDDGWFHTKDLAAMDAKGRIYIKGRLSNMILGPSGENIYPEEIEQVINNIEDVNESLVVDRDGHLVAMVKLDDSFFSWNQEQEDKVLEKVQQKKKAIMDFVNKRVNKQSKINDVEIVDKPFEKTATQKIRRFKYSSKK